MYVSFPKLPQDFTAENEEAIESVLKDCIERQKEILYKHYVTELEIVFAKEIEEQKDRRLVKHRVIFRDETGVTPEFGFYQEDKKKITGLRLCRQLYGDSVEAYGKIKKIEKKRVQTRGGNTTYAYDYPSLFGRACLEEWRRLREAAIERQNNEDRTLLNK